MKVANRMAKHLRSTASQGLGIWKIPIEELSFVSVSDYGGIGSKSGHVQNARGGERRHQERGEYLGHSNLLEVLSLQDRSELHTRRGDSSSLVRHRRGRVGSD